MCRWLAYSGSPLLVEDLLFRPRNSLVVQSRRSRLGAEAVNGDGFGIGWYGEHDTPALFRSIEPAWNDLNLRDLAVHTSSGQVFAHVRASTGTPIQLTNCHPFRRGHWLWMHNGVLAGFRTYKRDLMMAVDPDLYPDVVGSTDSEVLFHLALTFGLEDDPPGAMARAVGLVERVGREHEVDYPVQMTVATTDGTTTWAFRYSSVHRSRSLYRIQDVVALQQQHPDNPALQRLAADSHLVVSEPLGDLRGAWAEVPESSCLVVRRDDEALHEFVPSLAAVPRPA